MIIKQDSVVSGFRRLAAMFSAFLWDTVGKAGTADGNAELVQMNH